ncbi:hypothetical protein M427DRAFT_41182 [Gonapodya prolifera JEL478]|uniref:Uncharacterized protein n=1 Tax=Gonapodya prolifera (strain JEL478) TaxID=1344416 RepID=A0A139AUG2_GONPJ|nr:hypothetical protein M427DRAFT_41182 [Gonapodya prolifera JEL478]|eukprot:KXS20344.1 hypothetical protein M427DRAFT_41182 [Gonapodya prolifera JEL478]
MKCLVRRPFIFYYVRCLPSLGPLGPLGTHFGMNAKRPDSDGRIKMDVFSCFGDLKAKTVGEINHSTHSKKFGIVGGAIGCHPSTKMSSCQRRARRGLGVATSIIAPALSTGQRSALSLAFVFVDRDIAVTLLGTLLVFSNVLRGVQDLFSEAIKDTFQSSWDILRFWHPYAVLDI